MRYRLLFIILLISLSACTYQVQVVTPEPSAPLDGVSTTQADATLLPVETFTPPRFHLQPCRVFCQLSHPQPCPRCRCISIKFNPNGTYVDVTDSILAGAQ